MTNFLLIHGGSHGAWCWEGVIEELARLECRAHALDLPGGGEDATPRANVTYRSYVSAVGAFIEENDLHEVVLVGHSLAGIILPEVVARHRERIRQVVFLAAFVLEQGERAINLIAPDRVPGYYRLAEASLDYSMTVPYEAARERFFNDLDEAAAQEVFTKLTPQPLAPYLARVQNGANAIGSIARYIICTDDRNLPYEQCLGYAEKLGGTIEEIEAGHDVMLSKPKELAALLSKDG